MKKKYLTLALILTFAASLSACSTKATTNDSTPNNQDNSDTTPKDDNKDYYTIEFETNGGSNVLPVTVNKGDKLILPTNPTKSSDGTYTYTFEGWYMDSSLNLKFDANNAINSSFKLYAKWTETPIAATNYNVTFKYNNGSADTTISVKSGSTISKPQDPTKAADAYYSYTFNNWYKDSGLTQLFNFDTDTITGTTTLYAKYDKDPVKYLITYMNGSQKIYEEQVNGGSKITYTPVVGANCTFEGWYTDPQKTKSYDANSEVTSALTLYANIIESSSQNSNINVTSYKGYTEGMYVEFDKIEGLQASDYKISYKSDDMTDYVQINSNLVRVGTNVRADIVGLKEGKYLLKIEANADFKILTNINVTKDDRSGYAHFKNLNGIGAYNDDGTLKSNADVIYVSNATKNTVTYGGKTGLVKILTTTWNKPIDIRILDRIETTQFNKITYTSTPKTSALLEEQSASLGNTYAGYTAEEIIDNEWNSYSNDLAAGITTLNGLSSKVSYKNGEFDTAWNNCSISEKSNITVEGIGKNSGLYQWGFTWSKCNSIEVKNLEFTDYTEDACSFQSGGNGDVKNYGNFWVHNNTFNRGKNNWDFTYEQDKHYGDGATDFKNIHNVTSAYNLFNNCKKTGLVGGGDDNYTMNITFHHNLYNSVGSRLPLGRQANMHIYNNYYLNCGTCQDIRANAFVLSESNYFKSSSNPQKNTVTTKTATAAETLVVYPYTVIKSYNDYFESTSIISTTSSTNSKGLITTTGPATIVTTRDQQLSGNCKPDGSTNYTNFDTNPELFYYDSTNKKSDVLILNNATDLPTLLPSIAGSGKFANLSFDAAADVTDPVEPEDPQDPITPDTPTSTTTLLNEEFSSSITPTKTSGIPTSAGLFYSLTNDKDANTYNYVKVENGAVTVYDNSSKTSSDTDDGTSTTTYAYYIFNDTCLLTTGKVTYSVDLILSSQNSKWTMLQFIDENGLSLGIRSNDSTILGYTLGGETVTTMFSSKYSTGTYTIKLVIDYDNDTCQLSINNSTVNISYTPSTIKGLYFMTSAGSARTYKFDNIKVEVE